MVIETWESEEAIQDFTGSERFRQEIGASGMPVPAIEVRPVHNVQVST
jgi:heme-degrading monooxygenase HmoA